MVTGYEWKNEAWAKDVCHELSIYLYNWENDENKPPNLKEAVSEAKYCLSCYSEGGHSSNEELTNEDKEERASARKQVKALKAFIKKYDRLDIKTGLWIDYWKDYTFKTWASILLDKEGNQVSETEYRHTKKEIISLKVSDFRMMK